MRFIGLVYKDHDAFILSRFEKPAEYEQQWI